MRSSKGLFVLVLVASVILPGCGEAAEKNAAEQAAETEKEETPGFKVVTVMKSPAGPSAEVYFVDGKAVELMNGEVTALFDLDNGTFKKAGTQHTTTLMQAIAWAEERSKLAREALAGEEESPTRKLRERFVDPQFTAEEKAGVLVISNELMMYRIAAAEVTREQARLYAEYCRLNAYLRAMLANQFPPGVQLGITDELESRGIAPGSMYIETSGSQPVSLSYGYEPLTDQEIEQARGWLAN